MILLRMEKKNIQKKTKCIDDQVLLNIMDNEEVWMLINLLKFKLIFIIILI